MKMRTKTLTVDCVSCKIMYLDDDNNCICAWGKSKPKKLVSQKGKKPIHCNLKR